MFNQEINIERLQTYTEQDAIDLGVLRNALSSDRSDDQLSEERINMFVGHQDRLLVAARAKETGRIVGCETIVTIPIIEAPDEKPGRIGWLGFVATHTGHRRKGILKSVSLEGFRWCAEQGLKEMKFTSNSHNPERQNARKFYIDNGAVIIAKGVTKDDTDLFKWQVQDGLENLEAALKNQ